MCFCRTAMTFRFSYDIGYQALREAYKVDILMIVLIAALVAGTLGLLAWCGRIASEGSEPE
jgi:hypothetical protein